MFKVIVEKREEKYGEPETKEYDFYNRDVAFRDYIELCIILKGYEYSDFRYAYTDVFFYENDEIIDHRYFIDGCYA